MMGRVSATAWQCHNLCMQAQAFNYGDRRVSHPRRSRHYSPRSLHAPFSSRTLKTTLLLALYLATTPWRHTSQALASTLQSGRESIAAPPPTRMSRPDGCHHVASYRACEERGGSLGRGAEVHQRRGRLPGHQLG